MYKHPPLKNQRSKGSKTKKVSQICLLVAICFWLIFQVKRSYENKIEFKVRDTRISVSTADSDDIVKLGRKDLQPKLEEKFEEIEKCDEEENEHEEQEEREDGQSQTEIEHSLEDRNQDEVARNTHEAREEHYKADDASSAVTHDAQTISNENINGTLG